MNKGTSNTFSVLLLSLQNILKCMKADSVSGIEMI